MENASFELRICKVEYYMCMPKEDLDDVYSVFTGSHINLAPIIRIFGRTRDGKSGCLHVHGYYPYISIPFESDKHIDVASYKKKLASELDRLLSSKPSDPSKSTESNQNYYTKKRLLNQVYNIKTIKAIPFYGYHSKERTFLRIQFYNPNCVQRATEALQNGSIMNTEYEVYEAHLSYVLKFFIDYNLQGMNFIRVSNVYHRKSYEMSDVHPKEMSSYEPTTMCEIECDCTVLDIQNRTSNFDGISQNPGLKHLWDEERARKRRLQQSSQLTQKASQERIGQPVVNQKEQFYLESLKQQISPQYHLNNHHAVSQDSNSSVRTEEASTQYSTQDYVNIMRELIDTNNLLDSDSEVEVEEPSDEVAITHEMSQAFKDISSHTSHHHSPLDLSQSSDCSDTKRFLPTSTTKDEDLLYVCDCNLMQCCDLCCDQPSGHCDCESNHEQPTTSYQADNVYTQSSRNSVSEPGSFLSMKRFMQVDGSFDDPPLPKRKSTRLRQLSRSDVSANDTSTASTSKDFVVKDIQGTPVRVPRTFPEDKLSKVGSEKIEVTKIEEEVVMQINSQNGSCNFGRNSPCFFKTRCRGKRKMDYLMSLCRPLTVEVDCPPEFKEAFEKMEGSNESSGGNIEIPVVECDKPNSNDSLFEPSVVNEETDSALNNVSDVSKACETNKEATTTTTTTTAAAAAATATSSTTTCLLTDTRQNPSGLTEEELQEEQELFNKGPFDQEVYENNNEEVENPFEVATQILSSSVIYCDKSDTTEDLGNCSPATQIYCDSSDETVEFLDSPQDTIVNSNCSSNHSENPSDLSDATQVYGQSDIMHDEQLHDVEFSLNTNSPSRSSSATEVTENRDFPSDHVMIEVEESSMHGLSSFEMFDSSSPRKSEMNAGQVTEQEPELEHEADYSSDGIVSFYEYGSQSSDSRGSVTIFEPSSPCQPSVSPQMHSTPNAPYTSLRKSKRHGHIADLVRTPLETVFEDEPTKDCKSNLCLNSRVSLIQKFTSTPESSGQFKKRRRHWSDNSLIEGASFSDTFNFDISSCGSSMNTSQGAIDVCEHQYLTIMSLEVFTCTREQLKPNPARDSIRAVFYGFAADSVKGFVDSLGIIIFQPDMFEFGNVSLGEDLKAHLRRKNLLKSGFHSDKVCITYALDEIDLYTKLIEIVNSVDPDILVGYEIETLSWGYLLERANALNIKVSTALSRVTEDKMKSESNTGSENYFRIDLAGRIVLNLWNLIRHEVTLNIYTYENAHYHILHERIPHYSFADLQTWFDDPLQYWRTIEYYLLRVNGTLRMLDKVNLIDQTSELARVFGIQFEEVLNRGSQFRVESIMTRSAKPRNYILVSPSRKSVVKMRAPEVIPLVMEPESGFYTDPVAVLDFQSLYPSIIIAYNYCYSTCLGRLEHLGHRDQFDFGCSNIFVPKSTVKQNLKNVHISPNAVAFVNRDVRRGVLPQMLTDILDTRVMVKNAMKENKSQAHPSRSRDKLLNSRQLGLKLIANVTYGYTNANYSGRMPCVEIADAIVSKARETLENAIDMVKNNPQWGGKVIYGDTDSLFVLFPGLTKDEAFKKAYEIVDAVTAANPKPVKLKFEKIFLPCLLQTKKRYVGHSWETPSQKEPIFDAKGIETIRRDTCPAAAKILEKSLKILFSTHDLNDVRPYVQRQFEKILNGKISCLQDFIFAKEYRGKENYQPTACVPALEIAKRLLSVDPRAEPRKGERVPYVIVYGADNQPLIQLVKQPLELVKDPSLKLNAKYYIERIIIPALNRAVLLVGEDVLNWYKEIPRRNICQRSHYFYAKEKGLKPRTLSQYFMAAHCAVCDKQIPASDQLCASCMTSPQSSALSMLAEIRQLESKFGSIVRICQSCTGTMDSETKCASTDCPQLFRYAQSRLDITNATYMENILKNLKLTTSSQQLF